MSEEIIKEEVALGETSQTETANLPDVAPEEPERIVVFEEALEAILFAAGHPISYSTLARVFGMTPGEVKDKVFEYSIKYNDPDIPRGVILLTFKDSCQLCTKESYLDEIRDALGIKKSGTLSTSSLEVLAIIAYNQPVTRAFVDTLRRVDSSYAVNNLLDRGLITSSGRLDVPGRPMLYVTTSDFLRCFGLKDLDSLPATSDELTQAFDGARSQNKEEEEAISGAEQLTVDIDSALPDEDAAPEAEDSLVSQGEPSEGSLPEGESEETASRMSDDILDHETAEDDF